MKNNLAKVSAFFVALFLFTSFTAQSQVYISGPGSVNCGSPVFLNAIESGGGFNYQFFNWTVSYNGSTYASSSSSTISFTAPSDGGATLNVTLVAQSNDPINHPTVYAYHTISVTAGQLATPGSISGAAHACNSDEVTYSITPVSGATNYRWEVSSGFTMKANGNQVWWTTGTSAVVKFPASGSMSGSVSVKAYNLSNNCLNPSGARTKNIYGGPYLNLIMQGAEEVAQYTSSIPYYIVNSNPGATTYQSWTKPFGWSGSGNSSNYSLTVNDQSGYLVYNYSSCGQNYQLSKYVLVTLGGGGDPIERSANESSTPVLTVDNVVMYPNPASGTVKFTAQTKITSVEILGASGKKLMTSMDASDIQAGLDISKLQPGMYYVRIQTQEGELMKTLMVE